MEYSVFPHMCCSSHKVLMKFHPNVYTCITTSEVNGNTVSLVGTQISLQKAHMPWQGRIYFFSLRISKLFVILRVFDDNLQIAITITFSTNDLMGVYVISKCLKILCYNIVRDIHI